MSGNFSSGKVRPGNVMLDKDMSDVFRLPQVRPG